MDPITISGRRYVPVGEDSTVEHDFYTMERVQRAGLDRIAKRPEETAEGFAKRLLAEVIAAGVVFDLLGAFLLPEGVPGEAWTPALAAETGAALRKATGPDKALVQAAVVSLLLGFFRHGVASLATFPSSSGSEGEEAAPSASAEAPAATGSGESSSGS